MKTLKFRTVILLGIFLGMSNIPLNARQEISKDYHEEYNADSQTQLILQNKYGNIDIKDWDQQMVSIDVIVKVEHSNQEKAQRLLDLINIKFSSSGDMIEVSTELDPKFSRSDWGGNKEFEINYSVQMPKEVNLELHNKYGNVFISELTGEASIDVKYGKLTVNKLNRGKVKPLHTVNLAYAQGSSIAESNWLKVNMKYSKLNIDEATAVVAYSKYSKLFVDEASSIVIEGKYDEYGFGQLNNLVLSTSYSGLKVEELSGKLDLKSGYTGVRIEHMPASFKSVDIESKYGTVRVGIDEEASYNLDGQAKYCNINFPETGRVNRIQESNSLSVEGTVGRDSDPSATVRVVSQYGNVNLDY